MMNDAPAGLSTLATRDRDEGETRNARNRVFVPIGPTETIRKRLGLTEGQFSIALGFSEGAYSATANTGRILKTTALAAEALMRRQAASGVADYYLMVCVIKGVPLVFDITNDIREMRLDGVTYYLIPKDSTKGQP